MERNRNDLDIKEALNKLDEIIKEHTGTVAKKIMFR